MKWVGVNTHSSLFPENLKFSFPPKLGGMRGNEIRFNNFFTKTPKIPLYIQPFILKLGSNSNCKDTNCSLNPKEIGNGNEPNKLNTINL